ncbi:unnamed protein product, partial [Medioppia subpectinata]
SSSGIGEGIVKLFSILGANVVVTGRKAQDVQRVAKEVQELSPLKLKPLEVVGDLTKTSDVNNLIDSTVKTFGKIDVLVNNAGIYPPTNITQTDLLSVWDQIFAVDLRAVVELIHRSVPHLEKTNGTIIDISSVASLAPIKIELAYASAKAGLDMLTKILALELGPKNVRVNTINPGAIHVKDPLTPLEILIAKYTPLGRVGQPLDIARAVAFLASTDAQFITGANLVVDGGFDERNRDLKEFHYPIEDYKAVAKSRDFTGSVVVVTGSSSGIGEGIVKLAGPTQVTGKPIPFEKLAPKVTPLGRVGQLLDIARAVAFLASTDAHFITGANIVVDGGLVYNADYPIEDYKAVAKSRNFTGKVVLVTGSSSGIGEGIVKLVNMREGIVKLFSILGANVVVTGRKAQDVQRVAKEVQELSPLKLKPLEVVGDLTKTSDVNNLIDSTVKTFGKIDVLVNNAGIYQVTNITQSDVLSVWDQIFAVDLRAVVELIHRSVPHLAKTNGTIIDISSVGGIAPIKSQLAYSTAKAGLDMLTKVLALELGPKGIRVNTVNPGAIHVSEIPNPFETLAAKVTPLGRVGQPLDIARAVAFLASTDAHFITGANVVVDGGIIYNVDYPIEDYKAVAKSRDFTGKVILVTGSSSGIGEGIVKLFSILGANVVVTGRKAQDVQRVAKEVQELSPLKLKPLEVVGDLTKSSDVNNLIDSTVKTFGKIDVLINNAGIYPQTNITQSDLLSVWDQVFGVDLRAVVELIHRSVPHLEKTNGTIIDISSIGAIAPVKFMLAYAPAKAGMDMLTRILALELGPKGIRVNTVK